MIRTKFPYFFFFFLLLSCQNQVRNIDSTRAKAETKNEKFQPETVIQPRYSIVQSTLAAKGTFKLDSFTGDVYQLVVDSSDNEAWEKLIRLNHDEPNTQIVNTNNYILFVSTLAMKFTYLMNVNTGATWQLVQNPKTEENLFTPIE